MRVKFCASLRGHESFAQRASFRMRTSRVFRDDILVQCGQLRDRRRETRGRTQLVADSCGVLGIISRDLAQQVRRFERIAQRLKAKVEWTQLLKRC